MTGGKVAATALAAVTTAGVGAAAATGDLPAAMQDGIAEAAESVGLDLPDSSEGVTVQHARQDAEHRQDGEGPEVANGGNSNDVLTTLSGDEDVSPEDGADFGEAVSDNASENGEGFGRSVATTASDGASDQGENTSTTGSEADAHAAEESTVSDEYRPGEPPADAPSDSGDEFRGSGSDEGTGNRGDEHRPQ